MGTLILGTDRQAPPLVSAGPEVTHEAPPPYDHSFPLQSFAAPVRDYFQYCLPSWANIDLHVGRQRFEPQALSPSTGSRLVPWLDLRTGEAGLDGTWRCGSSDVNVRIRLLIPRGRIAGGFWELELDGLQEPAEIEFGLSGVHLTGDLQQTYRQAGAAIHGVARTQRRGLTAGLGLSWHAEGLELREVNVWKVAEVKLRATGSRLKLRVCHSVCGGTETWDQTRLEADLTALDRGVQDGSLRAGNERQWRGLWADALDVTVLPLDKRDRRFLLAQQFYLLASYDGSAQPTAPLGLSGNQWRGQMLWDTDFWHFRALNALWPGLARQPVRTRLAMLPAARKRATELGLPGAWFGWTCDEEGNDIAPPHYQPEIHVNAWVALAGWESARSTKDVTWWEEVYPLLAAIAEATCARAERDKDGSWHLRKVLPPDESVVEDKRNSGTCDDNMSTNLAFRAALRVTLSLARQLGREVPPLWREVAEGLVVLQPGPDGIIPEYEGYNGHQIKQADLILAFWPLLSDYGKETAASFPKKIVRANLEYYRERCGFNGPLMTSQVDACICLKHGIGTREEILAQCLTRYRRHVHGDFEVPYECVGNSNSLFLTGCGGLLQTLIYGWFDVRQMEDTGRLPRLMCY